MVYDNSNESTITISKRCHLGNLRLKNSKNIVFSYINRNSVCNKFENLSDLVVGNVDIISIGEAKLDYLFPISNSVVLNPWFSQTL